MYNIRMLLLTLSIALLLSLQTDASIFFSCIRKQRKDSKDRESKARPITAKAERESVKSKKGGKKQEKKQDKKRQHSESVGKRLSSYSKDPESKVPPSTSPKGHGGQTPTVRRRDSTRRLSAVKARTLGPYTKSLYGGQTDKGSRTSLAGLGDHRHSWHGDQKDEVGGAVENPRFLHSWHGGQTDKDAINKSAEELDGLLQEIAESKTALKPFSDDLQKKSGLRKQPSQREKTFDDLRKLRLPKLRNAPLSYEDDLPGNTPLSYEDQLDKALEQLEDTQKSSPRTERPNVGKRLSSSHGGQTDKVDGRPNSSHGDPRDKGSRTSLAGELDDKNRVDGRPNSSHEDQTDTDKLLSSENQFDPAAQFLNELDDKNRVKPAPKQLNETPDEYYDKLKERDEQIQEAIKSLADPTSSTYDANFVANARRPPTLKSLNEGLTTLSDLLLEAEFKLLK